MDRLRIGGLMLLVLLFTVPAAYAGGDDGGGCAAPDDDDSPPVDDDSQQLDDDNNDDSGDDDDDNNDDDDNDNNDDDDDDDNDNNDDTADDDDDDNDDDNNDDNDDDNDNDDDSVSIVERDWIYGGAPFYFNLAVSADGEPSVIANSGARALLFRSAAGKFTGEQIGEKGAAGILTIDAAGRPHLFFPDIYQNRWLQLIQDGGQWLEEVAEPDPSGWERYSELVLDGAGYAHIISCGWQVDYLTNKSGVWTRETAVPYHNNAEAFSYCEAAVAPTGEMYTGFIETYYDGHGHAHHQVIWATNETGPWAWDYLEQADGSLVDVAAGEDGVSYALYGSHALGVRYGVHQDGAWTWHGVPYVDGTMLNLFFVNGAPTILVAGNDPDYALSTLTWNGANWVAADLGLDTSYYVQARPAPDGTWRVANYDDPSETLSYASNESGDWVGQEVYQQPDVNECAGQGLDAAGRPHVLLETASGWQDVYDDGTQWRVEPVDFGLTGFYNVQMKADSVGTMHAAGYSAGNLIYAHNGTGVWETETVTPVGWAGPALTLRPDDQPAILYKDPDGFHLAERLAGSWQVEIVPSDPTFSTFAADVAVNAAGEAFVCYQREYHHELYCARRHDGAWTTELVSTGQDDYSPGIMALDPSGAPHYVSLNDTFGDAHYLQEHVFRNGAWETSTIGAFWTDEIGFTIDGDGVAHLVLTETNYDLGYNHLYYGDNASGGWKFGEIDHFAWYPLTPLKLPDGTVHTAYFSSGGLWRAVVAPM